MVPHLGHNIIRGSYVAASAVADRYIHRHTEQLLIIVFHL